MNREVTFRDLFNYIQECKVNDIGIHIPAGFAGEWGLHVYDNKVQVNVVHRDSITKSFDSFCNFVFDPEHSNVKIYPCTRPGICDYSVPEHHSIDASICNGEWMVVTYHGGAVKEVLRDLLTPYINK